ncbi:hypothetical protein JW721_00030 [Candidatus Micrarchaeota archaeon]|nr:hypothetical protein [Candidatus Micrarchaeota archaeon]
MHGYLNITRKQVAYFILLSAFFIYGYLEGFVPGSMVIFFVLLMLLRFINVKKYLEVKFLHHYPQYEHLPGWAKWAIIIVAYLLVFMAAKWVLMNVVLEGIFQIPIKEDMEEWMLGTYGIK